MLVQARKDPEDRELRLGDAILVKQTVEMANRPHKISEDLLAFQRHLLRKLERPTWAIVLLGAVVQHAPPHTALFV